MKKSRNIANKIKIHLKYFIKPAIIALLTTIIIVTCLYIQKPEIKKLDEICKIFLNIGISFSLTFIAFSITALALLQLLQTKEWFSEVSKSIYFKSFLKRILYAAKYCIILFVELLQFFIILNLENSLYSFFILSLSIFSMLFIVSWTWNCISDFITLFK